MGNLFEPIDCEAMSGVFGKGGLREKNGEVAVVMTFPGEGGAKKPIYWTHKVHYDAFLQFIHKQLFLCRIGGVENKIININANMD